MNKKMLLAEIFGINSGLVLSRKETKEEKCILYKQIPLKAINPRGYIENDKLEKFRSETEISSKYITKKGDLVIRLTEPYTAVAINEETEGLVVNSYCAVLRKNNENIMAEYVALYLNSGKLIEHFRKEAVGSVVQIIKLSSLKKYYVDNIPNLEQQKELVQINELLIDELLILENILVKKQIFRDELIKKLMEEM